MYKLAVCDDDPNFCDSLESLLRIFFTDRALEYSVASFTDIKAFDASVRSGAKYDLVFLDIMFDSDNGINRAKKLRSLNYSFDIIFITVCKEYAVESFDVNPLYYILKPIEPEKLTAALSRFLEKKAPQYICFNSLRGIVKMNISDILYFEIYGHRVIIHKNEGSHSDFRGSLKDIESQIPQGLFIRPHRSYLVNVQCISEIMHYRLKLTNGEIIPISKALYNKTQLEFVDYLAHNGLFT